MMELISTDEFLILQPLQKGENNLWIRRADGCPEVRPSWDLASQDNPECHGVIWALLGILRPHPELPPRLVVVRSCDRLCDLPGRGFAQHGVYRVGQVSFLPITKEASSVQNLCLKPCPKHQPNLVDPSTAPLPTDAAATTAASPSPSSNAFTKLGGSLKLLASDTIKTTAGGAAALASQVKVPWNKAQTVNPMFTSSGNPNKALDRFERRILEEFGKLFNDSLSFYFSFSGDLTNCLQRQTALTEVEADAPLWKRVDDRFFFNRDLLKELIALDDSRADPFIVPFIQGYVEVMFAPLNLEETESFYTDFQNQAGGPMLKPVDTLPDFYSIALISRRNRHRAGTRYKRRGVDSDGNVANYVETEQLLLYHHYALSFVLTRGSVPVHWSQPGYKYRPPPRLDKTPEEDREAFAKHFFQQFAAYRAPIHAISLVEKTGREKVIADAFFEQCLNFDSPDLAFTTFDFHEYCKGMHFENVSILIDAIQNDIKSMRYCWMDPHGVVCSQEGVFRVNCVDCLDRTNVVQTAIGRVVLEQMLTKLGVVPPDTQLPPETRMGFQGMWANNGDIISRQYAGTNALKGDFTRTGERNLSGLMKDGVNSASRYYLNQFRDAYRQAAIDLVTGQPMSETILNVSNPEELDEVDSAIVAGDLPAVAEEEDSSQTAEHVKTLLEDCKKLLVHDVASVVGAWGLIDNDPVSGDPRQEDMDSILILTQDCYYVAQYDDEADKVTQYQRVLLSNIEKIEFGLPEQSFSFGRSSTRNEHSVRLCYRMPSEEPNAAETGYFHMFRSTNLRFFNNMAVVVGTLDERIESLKTIADAVGVAMELAGNKPDMWFGKLDKRKSKVPELLGGAKPGSKALFSNVTSQFSRLNPISKLKFSVRKPPNNSNLEGDAQQQAGVSFHKQGELLMPTVCFGSEQSTPVVPLMQQMLSPLMPHHKLGEKGSTSSLLFPDTDTPNLNRQRSKSNDEVNLAGLIPEPLKPVAASLSINTVRVEEAVEETVDTVMSPFAKLSKGIQSLGFGKKGPPAAMGEEATENLSTAAAVETPPDTGRQNQITDEYLAKIEEASTRTRFIIL